LSRHIMSALSYGGRTLGRSQIENRGLTNAVIASRIIKVYSALVLNQ
jgi:hypothetical protein